MSEITVEIYDAEYGSSIERVHFDSQAEGHEFITREVGEGTKPGHTYAMVAYSKAHNPDALHMVEVITPRPTVADRYTVLGHIMLKEAGEAACRKGYLTTDPEMVGRYAYQYGDINADGTLN